MTPHPARVSPRNKCFLGEKESGLAYMTRSSKMVCAGSFEEGVMGRHGQGEVRATVERELRGVASGLLGVAGALAARFEAE